MRGTWLCEICAPTVPKLDIGICYRCGGPTVSSCRLCPQLDPGIARARAVYPYTGWVANAVKTFKYAEEWDRATDLGARLEPVVREFGTLDGIVPVPLHPRKLRQRGYNQAELLARQISTSLGIPVMPLLKRNRETRAQVELGRDARHANVRDAFVLDPAWVPASGSRLLLLDDVRTTGATVGACARTLLRTGPAAIYVATVALDIPGADLRPWLDEHASLKDAGNDGSIIW